MSNPTFPLVKAQDSAPKSNGEMFGRAVRFCMVRHVLPHLVPPKRCTAHPKLLPDHRWQPIELVALLQVLPLPDDVLTCCDHYDAFVSCTPHPGVCSRTAMSRGASALPAVHQQTCAQQTPSARATNSAALKPCSHGPNMLKSSGAASGTSPADGWDVDSSQHHIDEARFSRAQPPAKHRL